MSKHYDVVIVGSGQGGNPLASAFASSGKKTLLIEREHVGGTCVNEGCTPTKTMVASGRVAYLARRAADYGVNTGGGEITVDMNVVRQRKRDIVDQWKSGSERGIEETEGLELLMAEARFTGPKSLAATARDGSVQDITADIIVINVGERPSPPHIEGSNGVELLTSTTIMELDEVPEHLVVIGGGYIGLEFGQLFRRLGSKVTILHRGKHLLAREDPDIAEEVRTILREDGIEILLETQVRSIQNSDAGIELQVSDVVTLHASHVLAAAGRTPNSDSLDLEVAGVLADESGQILTDDSLETSVPGVFAIGDVRPGPKFTHISYDDYRILKANLIDGEQRTITDRLVPYVVFIDPQLGRIGLTEQDARAAGKKIRIASMPMASVARATETAEPRGIMKVVVNADDDQILGASILGIEGGEIMSMLQIAMWGKLPFTTLRDGIFAHPALSEGFNNLFFSFQDE